MHQSKHHRVPTSRGGDDSTIQTIPAKIHDAITTLFQNLKQEEMHLFIDLFYAKDKWENKEIDTLIRDIQNEPQRMWAECFNGCGVNNLILLRNQVDEFLKTRKEVINYVS